MFQIIKMFGTFILAYYDKIVNNKKSPSNEMPSSVGLLSLSLLRRQLLETNPLSLALRLDSSPRGELKKDLLLILCKF